MQTFQEQTQLQQFLDEKNYLYFYMTGGLGNQLLGLSEAHTLSKISGKKIAIDLAGIEHTVDSTPEWLEWSKKLEWLVPINFVKRELKGVRLVNLGFTDKYDLSTSQYFTGWKFSLIRVEESGLFQRGNFPFHSHTSIQNQLAIHFRAGDYGQHVGLGILSDSYYKKSINAINSGLTKKFFSDDVTAARALATRLNLHESCFFNTDNSAIDVLANLSSSRHLIAANSTLSWWAIYFGKAERIVAPDPFYLQDWGFDQKARFKNVFYVSRFKSKPTAMCQKIKWGICLRFIATGRDFLRQLSRFLRSN